MYAVYLCKNRGQRSWAVFNPKAWNDLKIILKTETKRKPKRNENKTETKIKTLVIYTRVFRAVRSSSAGNAVPVHAVRCLSSSSNRMSFPLLTSFLTNV